MRKDKKTKGKIMGFIMPVFSIAVFIGIGIFIAVNIIAFLGEDFELSEYYLWLAVYLLVLYAVYFLQIIIHEGGHLVFGLLTGYTFISFRIGSFIITKEDGKFRFARFSLAGTGGQCLLCPPEEKEGKIPFVLYNFGGVIFNVIFAVVCLALYLLLPNIHVLSVALMMSAVLSLYTAAANGIPMRMGLVNNDGYNGISLGKDKQAMRSFACQLRINASMAKGARLRDMPAELFELADGADVSNPINNTITGFRCNRLLDEHRFEEMCSLAQQLIEDENVIGIYKNLLVCDISFCEMLAGECDRAVSRFTKEQKKIMAAMAKNPSVIRTQYAYALLCEKDNAKAEKHLAEFEKAAKKHPYPGDIESERELIEEARKAVAL